MLRNALAFAGSAKRNVHMETKNWDSKDPLEGSRPAKPGMPIKGHGRRVTFCYPLALPASCSIFVLLTIGRNLPFGTISVEVPEKFAGDRFRRRDQKPLIETGSTCYFFFLTPRDRM